MSEVYIIEERKRGAKLGNVASERIGKDEKSQTRQHNMSCSGPLSACVLLGASADNIIKGITIISDIVHTKSSAVSARRNRSVGVSISL